MEKNQNSDVVFRRIRGRIIPIRVKKKRSKKSSDLSSREKRGAAVAVSGLGVGLGGGIASGALINQSTSLARLGRMQKSQGRHQFKLARSNQMILGEAGDWKGRLKGAREGIRKALKGRKLGRRAAKLKILGGKFAIASSLASGALIIGGIDPILDRRTPGREGTGKDVAKSFVEHGTATALGAGVFLLGRRTKGAKKAARAFRRKMKHW